MASLLIGPIQLVLFSIISIGLFSTVEINANWDVEEVLGGGRYLKQRDFDYFKLALQWPGTVCGHNSRCCPTNGCCQGPNALDEFTIHGLWADYNDGTWPSCCSGDRFNLTEISTLLDALNKYWPSFSCSKSSDCHGGKGLFWEHEWEKHGTCSSSVIKDEYGFFLTALNLYFKYNVTEVLQEAGYVPSNTEKYPVGGIISAVENAFHLSPELQCKNGAIEELRLCFYKDFKPRDCAADNNYQSHMVTSKACPTYVSLPAYVSSRVEKRSPDLLSPNPVSLAVRPIKALHVFI